MSHLRRNSHLHEFSGANLVLGFAVKGRRHAGVPVSNWDAPGVGGVGQVLPGFLVQREFLKWVEWVWGQSGSLFGAGMDLE